MLTIGKHSQCRVYPYICLCAMFTHGPHKIAPTHVQIDDLSDKENSRNTCAFRDRPRKLLVQVHLVCVFFSRRRGDMCRFLRFTSLGGVPGTADVCARCVNHWKAQSRPRLPVYLSLCYVHACPCNLVTKLHQHMNKLTIWATKKTAEVRVHFATDHAGCWFKCILCVLFLHGGEATCVFL